MIRREAPLTLSRVLHPPQRPSLRAPVAPVLQLRQRGVTASELGQSLGVYTRPARDSFQRHEQRCDGLRQHPAQLHYWTAPEKRGLHSRQVVQADGAAGSAVPRGLFQPVQSSIVRSSRGDIRITDRGWNWRRIGTDHFNCGHAAADSIFVEVFVLEVDLLNHS